MTYALIEVPYSDLTDFIQEANTTQTFLPLKVVGIDFTYLDRRSSVWYDVAQTSCPSYHTSGV